jgi:hypothetical protein
MGTHTPFREVARQILVGAFGEPTAVPVDSGRLYRWVLERPYGLSVYVTLDSPEMPDLGHVMISDPASTAVDPIASMTVRTATEVESLVDRIRLQWKGAESGRT